MRLQLPLEKCGVFAVFSKIDEDVFPYLYWGLLSLNHRGHQSFGFATMCKGRIAAYRKLGLVPSISPRELPQWVKRLPGRMGIGHVRYATSGVMSKESLEKDAQPIVAERERFCLSIAFNGNLVNLSELSNLLGNKYKNNPGHFSDARIMVNLLASLFQNNDPIEAIKEYMKVAEGAYSVVGLTSKNELFIFRDPLGIRPLCYGHSEDGKIIAFSSESVGLDINEFTHSSEVEPGKAILVSNGREINEEKIIDSNRRAFCSFEFAYFARPDSILGGRYVYEIREEFGRNLAREYSEIAKKVDLIISVPETADDVAYGFHEETGTRWERAIRRHRYVTHRAFILSPEERKRILAKKLNILGSKIRGKKIALIDDSIVRGDTTRSLVKKLKAIGADEVHIFVTFPRILSPCFYGIDMATYKELIGAFYEPDKIAEIIGANSVNYQPINSFVKATGFKKEDLCLGCLTGKYPTPLAQKIADEIKSMVVRGYVETGRVYETVIGGSSS